MIRKLLKKVQAGITVFVLTGAIVLGTGQNVAATAAGRDAYATEDIEIGYGIEVFESNPYHFTWTKTGDATLTLDVDSSRVQGVTLAEQLIDSSNYTVEAQDGKTVITLHRSFLQTLEFNHMYYLWVLLGPSGGVDYTDFTILEDYKTELAYMRYNNEDIKMLTYGEEQTLIDASNYTVTLTDNQVIINFNEEYRQSLPEDVEIQFHFSGDCKEYVELYMWEQPVISATPTPTEVPKEAKIQAPKTADTATILPYAAVCMCAGIVMCTIKKSNKVNISN